MATRITTVFVDCDGTLASNQVLYFSNGTRARSFSTYDGEGIAQLKQHGIHVAILTQSNAVEINARAHWLDIDCHSGIPDKAAFIEEYAEHKCLELDEICFMGNDVNDLRALRLVGYPACPIDCHSSVGRFCGLNGYVTTRNGGDGAFRELADRLIAYDFFDPESPINGAGQVDPDFVHPPYP